MKRGLLLLLGFTVTSLAGCLETGSNSYDPYGGSYRDPYYGGGYYSRDDYRDERRDIERERRRVERERRELERERRRDRESWQAPRHEYTPPPAAPIQREECPSGFSPRSNKCSDSERKRGCKDMRSASGRSCIRF